MAVDFRWPEALLVRKVSSFGASLSEELADRRLDGNFDPEQPKRLLKLGTGRTCSDPETRPSMRQIVSILDS